MTLKKPTDPEGIDKWRDALGSYTSGHSEKHTDPETGAVWYTHKAGETRFWAMGFAGKRTSPDMNYRFRSEAQMKTHLDNWLENIRSSAAFKAQQARKRGDFQTTLQAGDILSGTWGYDQTNAEFRQVISVNGNRVVLREIASKRAPGRDSMVVPVKDRFLQGEAETKVVQLGDRVSYKCFNLHKWDGHPVYETDGMGGH